MNLSTHYNLSNNNEYIVDVNIHEEENKTGHNVSILVKCNDSLCRMILPTRHFENLTNPVISAREFYSPYIFMDEFWIEIKDGYSDEDVIDVKILKDLKVIYIYLNGETIRFDFD